jgi:hypothetical protein
MRSILNTSQDGQAKTATPCPSVYRFSEPLQGKTGTYSPVYRVSDVRRLQSLEAQVLDPKLDSLRNLYYYCFSGYGNEKI